MSLQQSGPYQSQSLNQVAQIYQNLVDKCTRTYRYLQYNSSGVMQLILMPIFIVWAGMQNIGKDWQNLLGKKVLNLSPKQKVNSDQYGNESGNVVLNNIHNIDNTNDNNFDDDVIDKDVSFNNNLNNYSNQVVNNNSQENLLSVNTSFYPIRFIASKHLPGKKSFVSFWENSLKNWIYPVVVGVTSLLTIPDIKPIEKALVNVEPPTPGSVAVFTENTADLTVNNHNNFDGEISYNEQFLDAHFVPMGYVKHPLELLLEWVDKIIYLVEQLVVKIVNSYKD